MSRALGERQRQYRPPLVGIVGARDEPPSPLALGPQDRASLEASLSLPRHGAPAAGRGRVMGVTLPLDRASDPRTSRHHRVSIRSIVASLDFAQGLAEVRKGLPFNPDND